jgi:hypothetical protein
MQSSKPISHVVAGSIVAAVSIIFFMCLRFFGLDQVRGLPWINVVIVIGGLILFIMLYGKALHDQVSFGNLFAYGFKSTAMYILITIVFSVIIFLVNPQMKEKALESARQGMRENGDLTDGEINRRMEVVGRMFWVSTIGSLLLINAVVGAIGSLIGAAITKKKPFNPLDQLSI